jgi:cellulose synthase/poly-beta-1,6-N-acetylglucosamine synthase-like glycosyltransferase
LNASGTNVMFNERYNFPWGGSMAIRTEKMKTIDLHRIWKNAVSDDLTLNSALRKHGYRTIFVPQCIVATHSQATMRTFLTWATRQIALTRTLNRPLWNYGLTAYAFLAILMLLGIVSLAAGTLSSPAWFLPAALFCAPSVLGCLRSSQRITTFKRAVPWFGEEFEKNRLGDSIASLIVPWIMTYCIIKSARMNEIEWRGRKYKLTG